MTSRETREGRTQEIKFAFWSVSWWCSLCAFVLDLKGSLQVRTYQFCQFYRFLLKCLAVEWWKSSIHFQWTSVFVKMSNYNLKMAWGSGHAVIIQSLPILLISCTTLEHSAIFAHTHSCSVFPFLFLLYKSRESIIVIFVIMYVRWKWVFPPNISNKIPSPSRLLLHRFRFYSLLCRFYSRWTMLPQCGSIPEEKDCRVSYQYPSHYNPL